MNSDKCSIICLGKGVLSPNVHADPMLLRLSTHPRYAAITYLKNTLFLLEQVITAGKHFEITLQLPGPLWSHSHVKPPSSIAFSAS